MEAAMNPNRQPRSQLGVQLSGYIAQLHSMMDGADDGQLERHMDNLYVEYTKIREEVMAICHQLYDDTSSNRGSQTGTSSKEGHGTTSSPIKDSTAKQWPLSANGCIVVPVNPPPISHSQDDDARRWRVCLERFLAEYRRWLVDIYKHCDEQFTAEMLDNMFMDDEAMQEATRRLARLSRGIEGHSNPLMDEFEVRFEHYGQLVRDVTQFKKLTAGKRWEAHPRRVVQETISLHGDAILEFNTAMNDHPVLRFRVSSHILAECSPLFAHIFSKKMHVDAEMDVLPSPIQFSDADGSRIQLWRMPQPELNNGSALSILLHAAHMHNEHVPRSIDFERLVALAEVAIRYQCTKPLELFFEHCWLHQWIHKASDKMPDGLVTISYAFGRRRLFSRVTKSVILHLVDEEELRAKNWPSAVKDKIWAVRSAKMSQVYAACSETIEDYLRRPKASPRIPAPPISPVVEQPVVRADTWSWKPNQKAPVSPSAEVTPPASSSKRETWSWRPSSSAVKLPPVGSPSRPISRPIIQPPPPPPPPPSKTHSRDTSHTSLTGRGGSGILPQTFFFSSTPRCPKGSHWCDATNLGWLLLVYNELRLFSAILGPSALNGLSLSNQTNSLPRSLAQVLDALRDMANPPHPVHPGGGVCDPVPAFRDAINDIYNSVNGLALCDVDQQRHRSGLSMPRLHTSEEAIMTSGTQAQVQVQVQEMYSTETNKEDIFIRAQPTEVSKRIPVLTPIRPIQNVSMKLSAASMALKEENICLNILRRLDTFETIRAVAILNHRTYNIYKTNEQAILQNLVAVGRRQTMLRLMAHEAEDDGQSNKDEIDEPTPQVIFDRLFCTKISENSEGASTRAIKRASSDASSASGSSDSEGDWNFEAKSRSRCESLDITEGLGIAAATGHDTTQRSSSTLPRTPESPVVIKSPSSSSWLDDDSPGPPEYVHRGRGSSFYSITEQEAYRILWPPEDSASVPRERNTFGMLTDGLGCRDYDAGDENNMVSCGAVGGEKEGEDPDINLKYSRDDGWFALQHQGGPAASGLALEAKSLALMVEGNGNNKLLREEFDRRVGFAL